MTSDLRGTVVKIRSRKYLRYGFPSFGDDSREILRILETQQIV